MKKLLKNRESGFTLIEILVVIGIIAILATVVLVALNPARQFKQARDSQRVSNVNAILNAIGQNLADSKGVIPAAITTSIQNISNTAANLCAAIVPKYMPALPFDPTATVVDCTAGAYDTKYKVIKDANDRVTVSAQAELDQDNDGDVDANDVIKVTR